MYKNEFLESITESYKIFLSRNNQKVFESFIAIISYNVYDIISTKLAK